MGKYLKRLKVLQHIISIQFSPAVWRIKVQLLSAKYDHSLHHPGDGGRQNFFETIDLTRQNSVKGF